MEDAYYRWLIDLLGDEYLKLNYQKLLYHLFHTDYFWEIDYDGNRALDGIQLRKIFGKEIGYPEFCLSQGCSVLEMMIALSRRTDEELMFNPSAGDQTVVWFWTILQNLALDVYDDFSYNEVEVDEILRIFMHHLYAPDGFKGPFPCFGIATDLRKMDLWWQLNQYLIENFN